MGAYEPKSKRDNDAWQTDAGCAAHLLRHLGGKRVASLSLQDVEDDRTQRLTEKATRKNAPTYPTLDNEVELLERILNDAVERKKVQANPLASVKLLRKPNVRARSWTRKRSSGSSIHVKRRCSSSS